MARSVQPPASPPRPEIAALSSLATLHRVAAQHMLRREPLLLIAVALLAHGATISFGVLSVQAISFVLASAVVMAFALRAPEGPAAPALWSGAVAVCALTTLVYANQFQEPAELPLSVVLVASTVLLVLRTGAMRILAAAAAGLTLCAMAKIAWTWGTVDIDVFTSLQNASGALLHGANPYATTFAMPVMVSPTEWIIRPTHFGYLPGVALLTAPGRLVGDVRVMSVVAVLALVVAAVMVARRASDLQRPARVLALCLAIPLLVPMTHFAWVDVYSVAGFAAWVSLRHSHRRLAPLSLALALTVKPTIVLALIPFVVWSRTSRRDAAVAGIVALAVMAPFVVMTGAGAFYSDVAGTLASIGFRFDGLTAGAALYAITGQVPPAWFGLLGGAAIAVAILRHRPRSLSDALLSGALLSTAGCLLAKWAFLNYYFVPVSLLVLALASRGLALEAGEVSLPAPVLALLPRFGVTAARRATVRSWTSSSMMSSDTSATPSVTSPGGR